MKKLASFIFVLTTTVQLFAQPLAEKQIDSLVTLTLKTFNVPGIAVGIVKLMKTRCSVSHPTPNLTPQLL